MAHTLTIGGQHDGMSIDRITFIRESRTGFHYVDWPARINAHVIRADIEAPHPPVLPAVDTATRFFQVSFITYD